MASAMGSAANGVGAHRGGNGEMRYYRRFTSIQRVMHSALMLTFVGCALTGLPLLFSEKPWAVTLAKMLGGFQGAGFIHRICAAVMIVVFVGHVVMVFAKAFTSANPMKMFWGPDSMVPQLQDGIDLVNNFKWFLGMGPRPQFDRWTYWEKFDYWAVFWGMFIIGGSGLLLWFPLFFAQFLPGWIFNIAALVHGEEALLAAGFIFSIHFFNGHLRPVKFPMDTVIFTGRISEHEMLEERAVAFDRMKREGGLIEATPPTAEARWFGWIVGGAALTLGIVAVVLIVRSLV